jgi:hypothetical protein
MTGAALWDVLNRCRANQFCLNSISSNSRRITGISRNPEQSIGGRYDPSRRYIRGRDWRADADHFLAEPLTGVLQPVFSGSDWCACLASAPSTSVSVLNFSGLCGRMSSHSLNRPRRRRPSASTAVRSRCRNWPSADLRTVWTMRTVEPLGFPAKPVCWSW